jgi:hypothetical protein
MEPGKTEQPAPHAGERERGTRQDGEAMPPQALDPKPGDTGREPQPRDAESPTAKPQGTLEDQISNMESEGQAQPQVGDRTPEDLEREGFPPDK